MRHTTVTHRGEKVDIAYQDYGYEPDTNAHEIDWEFVDPALNASCTDEEAEAVYTELVRRSHQDPSGPDD